jgi:hypothetical protein
MEQNILNFIEDNSTDKLNSKINQLEAQIKKLTNENMSLKAKVNNLEITVEKICSQMNIKAPETKIKTFDADNSEEETWLYYVKKGMPKEKITAKLGFTKPDNLIAIDVSVAGWLSEKQMYIDILNQFEKFKEFAEDWNGMSESQLEHYLHTILSSSLVSDVVVLLRTLPLKANKNYEKIMSNIASLAGLMYNSWEELEVNNELIGRMALVLESEEELQILNILKNNSRLILFVIDLFKQ